MIRLFRKGQELYEVYRDDSISYSFQEIRTFYNRHQMNPGDYLGHTCFFDTRKQNRITVTSNGCSGFIFHYSALPEKQLSECKSSISEASLDGFFDHMIE